MFEYRPPSEPLRVLHEDDWFVVIDKPAGLLSVPGIAPEKQDCMRSRVQAMYPDATGPMTCHRLDLSTSGVMILALNAKTHKNLSVQFEFRRTQKRYIALLEGHLEHDEGQINCPLRKDMDVRPLMLVDYAQGKPSQTQYRVLSRETYRDRPVTRVELLPHTGRTHQLRVHAAHPMVTTVGTLGQFNEDETTGLGHPIVGDELYGTATNADRLMLHASMLTIHHPRTGKQLTFKAPDPF
ncbi:MAG: RNA pseudouridine synthase [Phycisphaerae bacterium]|nr:RNA pseudouridine synthase [Phycisphaerae bacterium]MBM90880.1 RNA pseudouridine synthase [Phycisphaerae bacterium]HCT44723.1 RNA pseudouridine synthase [Phycisphaerales bacterium]